MITGDELAALRTAGQRYAKRAGARASFEADLAERGILHVDEPARTEARLARLNVDWTLAQALERTPARANTGRSLGAALSPELFGADVLGLERLMGRNDLIDVTFLERGYLAARSIGRITVRASGGQPGAYGTGSLISPRLLLTNNHVLRNPEAAARAYVEFDYQSGLDGMPLTPAGFALEPDVLFVTDKALDFSVVAVRTRSSAGGELGRYGWLRLIEQEGKVLRGELVNIIQHPNGEPKQLALRENRIVDRLEQFLHYETDTAPGSSGSPVFNDQFEVVALHHRGVAKTDAAGNLLTVDGTRWTREMGEEKLAWVANEGARISRVLRALREQPLTGLADQLRSEVFAPPPLPAAAVPQGLAAAPPSGAENRAVMAAGSASARVTLAVPITITLDAGAAPAAVTAPVASASAPSATDAGRAAAADPEVRAALVALEASRTRDYFDAAADAAARTSYYAQLDRGADPAALFSALSELLTHSHTTQPRYKPIRHVYPWVDLHRDGMLRSIYSGKAYDPQDFIEQDAGVESARSARLQELVAHEAALGPDQFEAALIELEAALPYNCEHVVPQSSFREKEPMRGDLHHLFACESGCNSFRGNIPYFDFADFDEALRGECGRREEGRFEPIAGKGAVARATLYFLLRYPGVIGDEARELQPERLGMLLAWHQDHPVDEYEQHRNMAIAELQGNRNPLIDHPEWADGIDFQRGFG